MGNPSKVSFFLLVSYLCSQWFQCPGFPLIHQWLYGFSGTFCWDHGHRRRSLIIGQLKLVKTYCHSMKYWLVHRCEIDVPAMYQPQGRYRYTYGFVSTCSGSYKFCWRVHIELACCVGDYHIGFTHPTWLHTFYQLEYYSRRISFPFRHSVDFWCSYSPLTSKMIIIHTYIRSFQSRRACTTQRPSYSPLTRPLLIKMTAKLIKWSRPTRMPQLRR